MKINKAGFSLSLLLLQSSYDNSGFTFLVKPQKKIIKKFLEKNKKAKIYKKQNILLGFYNPEEYNQRYLEKSLGEISIQD